MLIEVKEVRPSTADFGLWITLRVEGWQTTFTHPVHTTYELLEFVGEVGVSLEG